MSQTELIEQCKYLIEFYGTTQQFIAKNIGVSRNTISLFLKRERQLAPTLELKLEQFLKERIK
ncbi:hypothetical protein [Clostridium taeniosporum]|uniref:XRE family transcriptional regulator n=1 Tax=Clostridium taeniosporum TaxID=394958 RepID=A0A1D7XKN7_9CLOT|nr:hypothetical protein [Clostridium taeniosporum]AOR23894.1 hypothetical protein BGI42_09225 [Clostridium taeniosporum]